MKKEVIKKLAIATANVCHVKEENTIKPLQSVGV